MNRQVKNTVKGFPTSDGAGVKLVRVLGIRTVEEYDPILMLDSFDSFDPDDYTAGFPDHPHRGIETISYVYRGAMTHKDSLGNEDTISEGEVQWMTAGSGIIHSETLPASEHMLGVQLWLNLPAKDKMTKPNYKAIKNDEIEEIAFVGGKIRLLAGSFESHVGYQAPYLPLDYYDIHLEAGRSFTVPTPAGKSILLFTLSGSAKVGGTLVEEKTAVKLTDGDAVEISATEDGPAQVLFISAERLDESVAWGGPIVMNTEQELTQAMRELRAGTFIKDRVDY